MEPLLGFTADDPKGPRMPVIETELTRLLGIEHPILLAPMGSAAGGKLAAAVTNAGGLGLVGSGYAIAAFLACPGAGTRRSAPAFAHARAR
jgi:NAD(P)H-dependent flavin oxidoreductase YrpB (nitropropane dioxygenase family)